MTFVADSGFGLFLNVVSFFFFDYFFFGGGGRERIAGMMDGL